ncbi:MAG: hypothetical protein CL908_23135 [Deltaproteobacteria bacterium]|nr:hypothetical protein [Deltaproteobacteria bacterium]
MADSSDKNGAPRDMTVPLTPPGARPKSGSDQLLGQVVDGRYLLKIVLGEGGMGKVYLAEDQKLSGRRVALKLMGAGLTMDQEFRTRFEREAVLQANLPHPQIIQILDMGECNEGAFIIMEYSEGRALAKLIRELGPLPLDRALELAEQVLDVLDFAHGQKVIHRDLKPANILVEQRPGRETVRLLDFGIAKLLSSDGSEKLAQTLTRAGFAYGTLGYMAPEQAKGDVEKVDHRVDIYACGILLHEMLTGEVPAPPESRTHPVRYAMWVAENRIQPLSESFPELKVAEQVDKILQKALRRDPDNRYQSALAFKNAIREFRRETDVRTISRPLTHTAPVKTTGGGGGSKLGWVAAAVLAIAGGVGGWLYTNEKTSSDAVRADLDDVKATFGELGFADEDVNRGIRDLKARIRSLEQSSADADPKALKKLQGEITGLKGQLSTAESERERLAGEKTTAEKNSTRLTGELASAQGDLGKAEERIKTLEEENRKLAAAGDSAVGGESADKITELEGRIDKLNGELTQLKESARKDGIELGTLRKESGRLTAERDGLKLDLEGKSAELSRMQGRVTGLEEEARKLRSRTVTSNPGEVAGLRAREKELNRFLSDANRRVQQLEAEVRELKSRVPAVTARQPVTLTIRNRFSHELRIRGFTITKEDGSTEALGPPATDADITSGQSTSVRLPAGTVKVMVRYWRFEWGNRRWKKRDVEAEMNVTSPRATIQIK